MGLFDSRFTFLDVLREVINSPYSFTLTIHSYMTYSLTLCHQPTSHSSLNIKQRLTLAVLPDHGAVLTDAAVNAKDDRRSHNCRHEEEHNHDDESKDPLEGVDFGGELRECQCW